jgi:hypothetical protein
MAIRTKWLDPDFRRTPKTDRCCIMCGRDLKPGQPHRIVRYELDRYEAIHPDDWDKAAEIIPPTWAPSQQDNCIVDDRLGMDCARKLGLEWSRDPQ